MAKEKVLLTGGLGYIASHTYVEILQAGFIPIIIDNLCNSYSNVLDGIQKITNVRPIFYEIDLQDTHSLEKVFQEHKIQYTIHFAALKSVEESTSNSIEYYKNNVGGTISLLQCMEKYGVYNIVFSSSACVYGNPEQLPIVESHPICPINPYGNTKYVIELLLKDLTSSNKNWEVVILRYFNPVGAHPSGWIGEKPRKTVSTNLMPAIIKAAAKEIPKLYIFGNDYPTKDGSCIRDYIHVVDLANAHVSSLKKIQSKIKHPNSQKITHSPIIANIGTGSGYSVLEMIQTFEKVSGKKIPYQFSYRRQGDAPICYANTDFAKQFLNWESKKNLVEMCHDTWNFFTKVR